MTYIWDKDDLLTRVHGKNIHPGEEFEPTEAELESFGDVIRETDTTGKESEDGVVESCGEVMTNGEICGRELPCPYHSD